MRFICVALVLLAFNTSYGQTNDLTESMKQGKIVYDDFCITCHMGNGEGLVGTFPPLAKSDYLMKERAKSIHAIKYGLQGEITVNGTKYNGVMANLGLTDEEVADVMNYITNSWGNKNDKIVTEKEVSEIKK